MAFKLARPLQKFLTLSDMSHANSVCFYFISLPTCQAIPHNQRHQCDVREDASEELPRHAQARDAFAPRRRLLTLIATC